MIARPGSGTGVSGVGAGLRGPHVPQILAEQPDVAWFELLTDNHLAAGGALRFQAEAIAERYPVTLHGVGMSLGGTDPMDDDYLAAVRGLATRTQAALISDHLAFTAHAGMHVHDLLPIPWTEESLDHVCARVTRAQDVIGRRILVENISAYVEFTSSSIPEPAFLEAVCERTGCGLLLDLNNVYVNAQNHGYDARAWLDGFAWQYVEEIHLAGHSRGDELLIDTHGGPVADPVMDLFASVTDRSRGIPVLIEWDTALPPWPVLLAEVRRVEAERKSLARSAA
jgi:uncharacterized protein (UPF0276 family)